MPNSIINERFPEYKKSLDAYGRVYSKINTDKDEIKKIHRQIKRFDIRFRLSMGLEINFNNEYSKTRNILTKDTYIMIYKTNDLWFLYEVFYKLADNFYMIKYNNEEKRKIIHSFTDDLIDNSRVQEIINNYNITLYNYFHKDIRRNDLILFLRSLNNIQIINKININEFLSIEDIQKMVYGNRNNFVHTNSLGMTALTGVTNYRTKIKILEFSYDTLINILFECTIYILNFQREKLQKEDSLS